MKKAGDNIILSPTEQYKIDILKLINKVEELDIDINKKGFNKAVKHCYWKTIKYIPKTVREEIKILIKDMENEIEAISKSRDTDIQKKQRILDIEYSYYNRICEYITKTISFSPIVEEEITGILETGTTIKDLDKLTDTLKKASKEEIFLLDKGESDEGTNSD